MDVILCVASRREVLNGERVPGRGGSKIEPGGRLEDDGKRLQVMDVVLALLLGEKS